MILFRMSQALKLDQALLAAAEKLVGRHGSDFTMGQLADELGVSRATLYRRGPSKTKLLQMLQSRGLVPAIAVAHTRDRIMEATGESICQRGLANTSIEQVAKRAGVSPVTVYRLFATRENLLVQFIQERSPRKDAGRLLVQRDRPIAEVLFEFVETSITWAIDHPGLWRAVMLAEGEEAKLLFALRTRNTGTYEHLVAYLTHQVRIGRLRGTEDPHALARDLLGMMAGAVLTRTRLLQADRRRGIGSGESVRERSNRIVQTFLYGNSAK